MAFFKKKKGHIMIRGHFRRRINGVDLPKAKWIWVEPFWRKKTKK